MAFAWQDCQLRRGLRGMKRNLALADLSWRIHQIQPDMAAKASLGTKHHVRTEEEHLRSTPDGVLCGGGVVSYVECREYCAIRPTPPPTPLPCELISLGTVFVAK